MKKNILILPHAQRLSFFYKVEKNLKKKNKVFFFKGIKKLDSFSHDEENIFLPDFLSLKNKKIKQSSKIKTEINKLEKKNLRTLFTTMIHNERDLGTFYASQNYLSAFFSNKFSFNHSENIILNAYIVVMNVVEKLKINLVISGTNTPLYHHLFYLISKQKKIDLYFNRRSKILKGKFFWTDRYEMYPDKKKELNSMIQKRKKPTTFSKNYLKKFRIKQHTVEYVRQNWLNNKDFVKNNLLLLFQIFLSNILYFLKLTDKLPQCFFNRLFFIVKSLFLKFKEQKYFFKFPELDLYSEKYVYLPLHKEPELALNYHSFETLNQLDLIKIISFSLPLGYKLFVKEHRFNSGRRPLIFLKSIKKLGNVRLINPFDEQFKYIKNSDLVITDNGTSGWEALILNKPLVNLSDSFYGILSNFKVKKLSKLGETMINILLNKKYQNKNDYKLGLFIDLENKSTFYENEIDIKKSLDVLLRKKNR